MLGQLESSFARLTEFSANLAHELRTPINNLRVEAEVALSRPRSAEEYRHTIESNTEEYERLSRMISDILFLARPEQGITPKQLDLRAELETLIDYYQTLAEERQISLTISGNGNVTADPRLFQRAAGNLLANALYYTQPGGQVTVAITQRQDGDTSVVVQDNGEGIPEHEIPLVFDRFYRSAQARQQRHEGSGLGLAIVRSIMELHGGSVTLASRPDHGTTATLTFPHT
jgi:two-component system heavy metal sensor histidine kinase CusS